MKKAKIGIFASGTGTNALNIIAFFEKNKHVKIAFVLSNDAKAPIVNNAVKKGVKVLVITNEEVEQKEFLFDICRQQKLDLIILAGFLRKIPADLVAAFPNKIINIHPALLPKFGGKGMYGKKVHEAVLAAGESESGITMHFVNEAYDEGAIIAQFSCKIEEGETVDTLQKKIHQLEMKHFPTVINQLITK